MAGDNPSGRSEEQVAAAGRHTRPAAFLKAPACRLTAGSDSDSDSDVD
jgi:hypothetical protein